eukprot:2568379-Pleurochrysis_carterae.AAC.4
MHDVIKIKSNWPKHKKANYESPELHHASESRPSAEYLISVHALREQLCLHDHHLDFNLFHSRELRSGWCAF